MKKFNWILIGNHNFYLNSLDIDRKAILCLRNRFRIFFFSSKCVTPTTKSLQLLLRLQKSIIFLSIFSHKLSISINFFFYFELQFSIFLLELGNGNLCEGLFHAHQINFLIKFSFDVRWAWVLIRGVCRGLNFIKNSVFDFTMDLNAE